jgi:hypothetical protein
MKQNYLYHWTDKKGFELIKKYGIRGEEGWLHTLLNNETGGLTEYIQGRLKRGEPAYGIRINLRDVIENDEGSCYINHYTQIGHPSSDDLQYYENMCKIDRCKSGCDENEKYKNYDTYIDYFYDRFEKCGNERGWSKEEINTLSRETLDKLFELKGNNGCNIEQEKIEYTKVDNVYELPKNLKYKKLEHIPGKH